MDTFDSWLSDKDVDRLWRVVHGELPELAATADEIDEFQRVVTHAAMLKIAGKDYQTFEVH
jgi:hypothetical protein